MLKRERQAYLVQPINLHITAIQSNLIGTEQKVSAEPITGYLPKVFNKIFFN